MLTAYALGKIAAEVVDLYPGKSKPSGLAPSTGAVPVMTVEQARMLADAMTRGAGHDALLRTRVNLGGANFKNMNERITGNEKLPDSVRSFFENNPAIAVDTNTGRIIKKTRDFPDAYMRVSDDVHLPSRSHGTMLHELGHAIDANEFPEKNFGRKRIADMYWNYAPTLWQEHAAWRKGRDRFLGGATQSKLDPEFVADVLQSVAQERPPALGSYWGHRVGSLLGGGLGIAGAIAALQNSRRGDPMARLALLLPFAGYGLGSMLGIGTGWGLGKLIGGSTGRHSPEARSRYVKEYVNRYAKEHNVTHEEAQEQINNLIEQLKPSTTKTPKKRRAA